MSDLTKPETDTVFDWLRQYRERKARNHRLQRVLKECLKEMQASVMFGDTKAHKDLIARIRVELEVQP